MIPPAPTPTTTSTIDVEQGLEAHARRMGARARRRRGIRRPPDPAGRQRQRHRQAPGAQLPEYAEADARGRRRADDAARMGAQGRHHQGDDLRRRARESRPQEDARERARRSSPTARASAPRVPAFVTPEFVRDEIARGRAIIPVQHQPRRTRADDHRPQFPGEDQRQYRQLGGVVLGRGGSREDGVGDPLGRRHRDGPLHRPQHPQHARMDLAQFAGADRHRADLSGAGEVRRRSGQARPGSSTRTR